MSDLTLVIKLSEEKAKRYIERFNAIKQDAYARSLAFNAYYQGMLDANCDEVTLRQKNAILISERDRLLEDLAKVRDKKVHVTKIKEVEKVKVVSEELFI